LKKKSRTLDQVRTAQGRAVRFVRTVLRDDDRADEIEAESPESYAERKGIEIIPNPSLRLKRGDKTKMASRLPTKPELVQMLEDIYELTDDALDPAASRRQIVEAVQKIAEIASPDEDDDEEEDADDDDEDDE
jgi:hypothetical protein